MEQELRNPSSVLSPQSIRRALLSMNHVLPNQMGDSVEAFEDILQLIHDSSSTVFLDLSTVSAYGPVTPYEALNCEQSCLAHSVSEHHVSLS